MAGSRSMKRGSMGRMMCRRLGAGLGISRGTLRTNSNTNKDLKTINNSTQIRIMVKIITIIIPHLKDNNSNIHKIIIVITNRNKMISITIKIMDQINTLTTVSFLLGLLMDKMVITIITKILILTTKVKKAKIISIRIKDHMTI